MALVLKTSVSKGTVSSNLTASANLFNMFKNYYIGSHKDYISDISPLIHCIGLHGHNLVGLELGVAKSDSFMTILDNCANVSKLYGIDNYQPFYDNFSDHYVGEFEVAMIKAESLNKHKFSKHRSKIEFLETSSIEAVTNFKNEYFDFIFIDADHSYQSVRQDLEIWYPKIKPGGLISGHDYHLSVVETAVNDFRKENNITSLMSSFLSCYVWKK